MSMRRRGSLWNTVSKAHDIMATGQEYATQPAPSRIALPGRFRKGRRRGVRGLVQAIVGLPQTTDAQPRDHAEWALLKEDLIARTNGTCESCEFAMHEPTALHLHHVVPRSKGGLDEAENAALLCPNCHAKAHWIYRSKRLIPSSRAELFNMLAA